MSDIYVVLLSFDIFCGVLFYVPVSDVKLNNLVVLVYGLTLNTRKNALSSVTDKKLIENCSILVR